MNSNTYTSSLGGTKILICAAVAALITGFSTQLIFSGDGPSRAGLAQLAQSQPAAPSTVFVALAR